MKKCPQCNSVFEDDMRYCKEDGTTLVDEAFSMPSDFTPEDHDDGEQETVMRYKPINFDFPSPSSPPKQPQIQPAQQPQANSYAQNQNNIPPQTPSKSGGGCLKYSLILMLGLLIGGGIALGMVVVGYFYLNNASNENPDTNKNIIVKNTPTTEQNNNSKKSGNKHSKSNEDVDESKLNGRVIKRRASLRSSPSRSGRRIDRLPKNDRLEIIKRKSSTSKWYQVECEHGSRGWIDGYSIEFTE